MEKVRVLSLTLSTLSHATEEKSRVLQAIAGICSGELSREPKTGRARGHYGNEIFTMQIRSASASQADRCFEEIWRRLTLSDREHIVSRLSDLTDSSGTLFMRIDKEESFRGKILLGGSEMIKVEVRFGIHSTPRDVMLQRIENWMETISLE